MNHFLTDVMFALSPPPPPPPCAAAHLLRENRFQPPAKRLPDLPICAKGVAPTEASPSVAQCLYQTADGVTWGRTHSTDHLVRQENLNEYPPLAKALRVELGRPVRTVVDAGANDGLSTRLFATGLPEATVIAVEPALSNYAMVLRNTRDLGPRVVALRAAVWNSSTTMTVGGDPSSPWSMSVVPSATSATPGSTAKGHNGDRHLAALPGVTMPSLLDALCAPELDFLKMDIEGAELSVLVPGSAVWLRRVRYFYMEAHRWARDPATHQTAVFRSTQALVAAGMTVVTNPNLTMHTWMPSRPRTPEYVFLACHQEVPRARCMALCQRWRQGTGLGCEFVMRRYKAAFA